MATSHYEIQFSVTQEGQVTAKVKGLHDGFVQLDNAINDVNQDLITNQKTLDGTTRFYDQQINKIKTLRDATANSTEEYREHTAAIEELQKEKAKLSAPMENTLAAFRAEIQALRTQQQEVAKSREDWQYYEDQIVKVKTKINDLTGATRMSAKPNQDMISNAGLAGATLTELGRTISDANYGIRGMANNLSQLSTLFITLVAKTEGGFIPALTMLGKQIWGPLGLILGFQFVVQQLEAYSMRQDEAARSTANAGNEILAQGVILRGYVDALNDTNTSEDERNSIIEELISQVPTLKREDFEYGKNLDGVNASIREYIKSQVARAESNQLIIDNTKDLILADKIAATNSIKNDEERAAARAKLVREETDAIEFLQAKVKSLYKSNINIGGALIDPLQALTSMLGPEEIEEIFKELETTVLDRAKPIQERLNELVASFLPDSKKAGEEANKTSTIYQDLSDELAVIGKERFDAQMIQAEHEYRDTISKIEEEQKKEIITAEEAEKAKALAVQLRTKKEEQIEKERSEYILDLTEKERERKEKDEQKMVSLKEKTSKEAVSLIDQETTRRINAEKKVALEGIKDKKLLQAEFNRIDQDNLRKQIEVVEATIAAGIIGAEVGGEVIEKLNSKLISLGLAAADPSEREVDPQKKIERTLRQVEDAFNFITNAAMTALDAEMSIEEARTARLNNNLRLRLRNEKLTAEQKEAINAQIAKNEEALQQKRDKLAEKQFRLQKAISIGQALITTYEMATRAYNAVLAGPEKFLGISALALAKAAAATATLLGLAQVRAISRQQFVPSAISVPSGGGGAVSSPTIQAPDFNVVGQSNVSQLAEVVQGQLNRPVKTYVVASDVSTAQELERKKISTATI